LKAQGDFAPSISVDYTGITGLDDLSDQDSFDGFDFDTTWEIDEYSGYPVFRRGQQHVTFDPAGGTCAMESKDYAIGGLRRLRLLQQPARRHLARLQLPRLVRLVTRASSSSEQPTPSTIPTAPTTTTARQATRPTTATASTTSAPTST